MEDQNFSEIKTASEPCAAYEGKLQEKWTRIPVKTVFYTVCGKKLIIHSRGTWNFESGPDFKNAKISLDGTILNGDIEIHVKSSDWVRHKHQDDPAFNNVILHVVETFDSREPDIPIFLIPEEDDLKNIPHFCKNPAGRCSDIFQHFSPEELTKFFQDAGLDRMKAKSKLILADMISSGTKEAFLLKFFEALGFRKNKEAFAILFQETVKKYPAEQFETAFEEILWGESGLIPADSSNLPDPEAVTEQQRLWNSWWKLRRDAGQVNHWTRSALRPANTPERRIAALCEFIRKNGTDPLPGWIKMLESSESPESCMEKLCSAFCCDGGFWADRISFKAPKREKKMALSGKGKALELVIDVAIPCLHALAELEGSSRAAGRLAILMKQLPAPESNSVVRNAAKLWFKDSEQALKHLNDAASRQGIHHIYSEYCAPVESDCSVCLIKHSYFQK